MISAHSAHLGILVKASPGQPPPPSTLPGLPQIAAWASTHAPLLYLSPHDVEVVSSQSTNSLVGSGWSPDLANDTWQQRQNVPLGAIYNRFPRLQAPAQLAQVAAWAVEHKIPFANHPALQELVWDKVALNRALDDEEFPVPQHIDDPDEMHEALSFWGAAYLKPRCGAFGEGISLLSFVPGRLILQETGTPQPQEPMLPEHWSPWLRKRAREEDLFLERAIPCPFPEYTAVSVRSLVQRDSDGAWHSAPRVARCSPHDPVANVARGALALPLVDLCTKQWGPDKTRAITQELDQLDRDVASWLQTQLIASDVPASGVLELGIDYVLDEEGLAWLLEVNGFPQGRLQKLVEQEPDRFEQEAHELWLRPLRTLWHDRRREEFD